MRYGQMHYAVARSPGVSPRETPLVMFHQTPNSLVEFGPLIGEMGRDRLTIAIDTPGYGGSDAPPDQPRIEDYAAAICEAFGALGLNSGQRIDLLGNHTGAFIATALAVLEPLRVRRVALIGVFVVPDEVLATVRAALPDPTSYTQVMDQWCARYPIAKAAYEAEGVPDSAWALQADSLRPIASKREYGHQAAFEYAERARTELPKVTQPVLLMAVADNLEEATRASAPLFRNAELLEMPHIRTGKGVYDGVFYNHTEAFAIALRKFLSEERD
ncbi:MAG TPA: alpha/beta fold hydrolase [Steroidobacteraceae bacterium]